MKAGTTQTNKVGKKKVSKYTEGQCDAVLNRLQDERQDNSAYAREVAARRDELVAANIARAKI